LGDGSLLPDRTRDDVDEPMLEGYSALSYLAAFTGRVKLGTLVTGMIYRYPGLLVKTATTLDVLSGGRAYLGIGAGWNERESRGLGVPFHPLGSASSGWKKPSRSRTRCGQGSSGLARASTTSSPRRSTAPRLWASRSRRS
jgi:hypothetical protein